ncbi:MAG: Gfo/Idh/MocA family oxidoreductase [Pirellulales bacterium]
MPLRIAVIGAGHLGRFHAKLLGELDDVELVGVVDPVEESALRVAAECNTSAIATVKDLLGRIDAAIVATPTRFHHAVGCELLRNGVHVLIEKPLALNVAECDELVRLAEQERRVLQVGHIERFNPALDQALPYLQNPKYIDAARYSGYTFRSTDIGVVLDLMIHDLDVVMMLVGSPVADVSAFGLALMGRHEDVARTRLHFANGAIADLSASRVSYEAKRQMQVWSPAGHVNIDFATRTAVVAQPAAMLRNGSFDPDQLPLAEKARLKDRVFEELIPLKRLAAGATNALLDEQRDFITAIRAGRQPRVTGRQAREVIVVAERILASIANQQWRVDSEGAGVDRSVGDLVPAGERELRPDGGADILRGPHWHRTPVMPPREIKRPA